MSNIIILHYSTWSIVAKIYLTETDQTLKFSKAINPTKYSAPTGLIIIVTSYSINIPRLCRFLICYRET